MKNYNNLNDTDLQLLIALCYFALNGIELNITQLSTYSNLSRPTIYKKLEKFEEFFTLDNSKRLLNNHKKLRGNKRYEKISKILKAST